MVEIRYDYLKKLQKWGMQLTPVRSDKKPELVNGKWFYGWTLKDLAKKERIGVWHKSGFYDIDFDDEKKNCHKFMPLFPETYTTGKMINGKPVATHLIYNSGTETPSYESYPSSVKKGGKKIELLTNKQTWILGDDRVVIKDISPSRYPPSLVSDYVKMTYAFGELLEHWPESGIKMRDEAHMRLAGALARDTKIITNIKEEFVKKLCELTFDTEINNRVRKIKYQEKQFKENPEKVWGIGGLSTHLGVNLPAFDVLKNNVEKGEINKNKTIIFHSSLEFSKIEFPKPVYILEPYIREQTITALIGEQESGKTMTGMRLSGSVANAKPWLDSTAVGRPRPTLYIEGDLPADDIKTREGSMIDYFNKRGWGWNTEYFHLSTLQQQMMVGRDGFTPLQSEQGQLEIENAINEIAKRTGQRVYVHFDNISCLAPGFEENKAEAWSPLIRYFLRLKSKGHIINYHHHLNKGKDFSGSTMQVRAIDMAIRFQKLDSKHKIEMPGEKNVQCKVDFDIKWRLHGNSKFAKPFILTCDEQQNWRKRPLLDKNDNEIMRLHNDGYDVEEMKEEIGLAEKTIYKKLKKLKDNEFIKEVKKDETNRQTVDGKTKKVC